MLEYKRRGRGLTPTGHEHNYFTALTLATWPVETSFVTLFKVATGGGVGGGRIRGGGGGG